MQSSQSFLALGHLHPWLSSFFNWCRQPSGTGIPPRLRGPWRPGAQLSHHWAHFRHFLRQSMIFRRHRLAFRSWTCCLCLSDTTKLATPGTCGCIFAAALLLPNQRQKNALDPTTTQKKGDVKSLPGPMVSPGPSPSERVPAMIKIAFKAMHGCSLLSGIWKTLLKHIFEQNISAGILRKREKTDTCR